MVPCFCGWAVKSSITTHWSCSQLCSSTKRLPVHWSKLISLTFVNRRRKKKKNTFPRLPFCQNPSMGAPLQEYKNSFYVCSPEASSQQRSVKDGLMLETFRLWLVEWIGPLPVCSMIGSLSLWQINIKETQWQECKYYALSVSKRYGRFMEGAQVHSFPPRDRWPMSAIIWRRFLVMGRG